MKEASIICSSKSLYRRLMQWEWHNWDDKGEIVIVVSKNRLSFKNSEQWLDVETKFEGEFAYDPKMIKRLRKVCKAIQEQPIVLIFMENDIKLQPPVFI
jgi:hypothetical protein